MNFGRNLCIQYLCIMLNVGNPVVTNEFICIYYTLKAVFFRLILSSILSKFLYCTCTYMHTCYMFFITSNIAVMNDNSVATLRDKVDFKLESVSALDYYVKDPLQPQ